MKNDMLIVDSIVHGYNWAKSNWAQPTSALACEAGAGFHGFLCRDEATTLTRDEFLRDWSSDEVAESIFYESQVDIACHHGTPIWDFFKDGHCDTEKGFAMKARFPERTMIYGAINPYDPATAVYEMEELVDRGVNGLKIYAARFHNGKTYDQRLDDPKFGYDMIEKALKLGVKTIAVHKAVPFGPVRPDPYGVADVPEACTVFPEMNFEIVHSGFAFVDETVALAGIPNCWFNLEVSSGLIFKAPRRFAEFMGKLLQNGAGDRIVWASGCCLTHPQPIIDAFFDFQMPQDLVEGFGYPQMTPEILRGIMGENFLRLHGIDSAALKAKIAGDEVSQRQAAGLAAPWTHFRDRMAKGLAA